MLKHMWRIEGLRKSDNLRRQHFCDQEEFLEFLADFNNLI